MWSPSSCGVNLNPRPFRKDTDVEPIVLVFIAHAQADSQVRQEPHACKSHGQQLLATLAKGRGPPGLRSRPFLFTHQLR
jgi:hypothetical protein